MAHTQTAANTPRLQTIKSGPVKAVIKRFEDLVSATAISVKTRSAGRAVFAAQQVGGLTPGRPRSRLRAPGTEAEN